MTRCVYVNGRYRHYSEAAIHAEDRGFQFADSVYEVIEVRQGRLVDETRHLDRLGRSLREIFMRDPMSRDALRHVMREVVRRNRVSHGTLYLQVSRGQAPRDFAFPPPDVPSTVVCLARSSQPVRAEARAAAGIAVRTMPDQRWARCDIKTTMLLPSCLAKREAMERGAREAWLVDREGYVTEGASSNAWIVSNDGEILTRPSGTEILSGVTRRTVLDVATMEGLRLVERRFTVAEAMAAREAFITSASNTVMPVVEVNGSPIGDSRPGPVSRRLRQSFHLVAELAPK